MTQRQKAHHPYSEGSSEGTLLEGNALAKSVLPTDCTIQRDLLSETLRLGNFTCTKLNIKGRTSQPARLPTSASEGK